MAEENKTSESRYVELEKLLKEVREEAVYYKRFAIDSGKRTIREINQLSQLFTKHKQAEDKLKESEEKYRKVIENIYDIVYSSSTDGTLNFISPNVLSIIGYKPEEIIGHNPIKLVHPDDKEHVLKNYEKTIKTGEEFPTIFRLLKKDGSYFYVEEFGKVVREGDKIVGVTGVLRDITERKQAEEALLESEKRFRSLFESATEFIHILDKNGTVAQANPAATLQSGYTEEELIGRSIADLFTSASQKIFVGEFPILMEKGNHRVEVEFVCKDGTIIISDCSCMVVHNERGEFAYIVTFLRDITERKKAEEKLKLTQKELEIKAKNLEETNTALKVLLKHQDTEKNIMEKNILTSLKTLVLPYLEKIYINTSDERQKTYVNIIETNLSEITKPFTSKLTESYSRLTPTEVQITSLIRKDKTAKDIARILDISETTVFFHRRNIRKKLGLKNKKTNLRSYLQSSAST
ncbi:PAS domain S-box protein [Candidatus Latescibacterota bacterium]